MKKCSAVPYEGEEDYLFISYSHKDSEIVIPILEKIEESGYRIWFDEGIDPGSEWPETIADHLNRASVCVGFITENYLNSQNCRRELNFALKKQIPFLSIMLEKVELSPGVDMQLSANQAIFKYLIPSEEKFFEKINTTKFLLPTRKLPPPKPEEAPTPSFNVMNNASGASEQAPFPVPQNIPKTNTEKYVAPLSNAKKSKKEKKKGKSKKPLVIVAAVLALVVVCVIVGTAFFGSNDSSGKISKKAFLAGKSTYSANILFGKKVQTTYTTDDDFFKKCKDNDFRRQYRINGDQESIEASVYPYKMEVKPDKAPNIILLTFVDYNQKEYKIQGYFQLKKGVLKITPIIDPPYKEYLCLGETIEYKITLSTSSIQLKADGQILYVNYGSDSTILRGSANDLMFKDIKAIKIEKLAEGRSCDIKFSEKGNYTADAKISYVLSSYARIDWTYEMRNINNVPSRIPVNDGEHSSGSISLDYFNTYPYGFILFNGDEVYFYQEAF